MVCESRQMSYLIGKLMQFQRQRDIYDRLLNTAPGLDLSRTGTAELARFLQQRTTDPLTALLRADVKPPTTGLQLVQTLSADLLQEPTAWDALERYPLGSPKMLGAAKAHGLDERLLIEVEQQLDEGR